MQESAKLGEKMALWLRSGEKELDNACVLNSEDIQRQNHHTAVSYT